MDNRQLQLEDSSPAWLLAKSGKPSTEFFCSQGAAVEAETVAIFPGREPVIENPGQFLGRNPNSIVYDRDFDATIAVSNLKRDLFGIMVRIVTGIFCITDQVQQNLLKSILLVFLTLFDR